MKRTSTRRAFLLARNREVEADRARDEATVALLRATSTGPALVRVDYEERYGIPAHDAPPPGSDIQPRQLPGICARAECGRRFFASVMGAGRQLYCSSRCMDAEVTKRRTWRLKEARRAS